MGLNDLEHHPEHMVTFYPSTTTLTREEKARMHPCKKAKCVMMTTGSSPTLQTSLQSPNYVELPDEPRPGKITPTTPTTNTTNPSPSPTKSSMTGNGGNGNGSPDIGHEEDIEEVQPIVQTTLPSPEPRPLIERNGYKEHDRVDASVSNGFKSKAAQQNQHQQQRDVDDDSCLIKCVYFAQQCCECTII